MTSAGVPDGTDPRGDNLALWEGLAALHGGGIAEGYYDIDALIAGRDPIHDEVQIVLRRAFPDGVAGLDVLHVQSHIAVDSIELARRGARVTAVDFSPTALAEAARIAQACGVPLDTVRADSTDLPASLHDRFDLAYATIGVIQWIADLPAWMRSVAACLRPGGQLLLVEIHPLRQMADELEPLVLDLSYTHDPAGLSFDEDGSYADPDAKLPATKGTVWAHSLGETVTAAVDAGLRIEFLDELTATTFDPNGTSGMTRGEDGLLRWGLDGAMPFPVLFSLLARRATD